MKLSEAIVLGLGFVEFEPTLYLSIRRRCGCLLGAGFVSVKGFVRDDRGFVDQIAEVWPWLTDEFPIPSILQPMSGATAEQIISVFAHRIKEKRLTLDHALAWIRSVEPSETTSTQSDNGDLVEEKIL